MPNQSENRPQLTRHQRRISRQLTLQHNTTNLSRQRNQPSQLNSNTNIISRTMRSRNIRPHARRLPLTQHSPMQQLTQLYNTRYSRQFQHTLRTTILPQQRISRRQTILLTLRRPSPHNIQRRTLDEGQSNTIVAFYSPSLKSHPQVLLSPNISRADTIKQLARDP